MIDAQSVKTFTSVPAARQGTDAAKKIVGRKRSIVTDTLGLLLAVLVTAASVQDSVAGTHLVLDQKAAGYHGTAYVFITLDGQERERLDAFEARVKLVPQIQECYLLAGQSDYLLRVVFHDMEDLERLHSEVLTRVPGVMRVQSTLTLRTVKRTTRLPL